MAEYEYDQQFNLYNSQICRLCCVENANGTMLYMTDEDDISLLINSYLPIKISNDGNHPRWICPGCHLQMEATVEFFDLVINGQEKLRELLRLQQQQATVNVIKFENDGQTEDATAAENVMSEGMFKAEHELRYRMEGIEKPKKKRGRPPRPTPEVRKALEEAAAEEDAKRRDEEARQQAEDAKSCEDGRRKRRVKIPVRFQQAVQGKELERIYVEKGVIDRSESMMDDSIANSSELESIDCADEIIGHLQDTDGSNLADLVFESTKSRGDHKSQSTQRRRKTKFMCDVCNRGFIQEFRYLAHRSTHHNVRYECTQCITQFTQRCHLSDHQKSTGHTGEGIIENLDDCDRPDAAKTDCNESVTRFVGNDDVLDDIKAARMLYDLQNTQTSNTEYITSDFYEPSQQQNHENTLNTVYADEPGEVELDYGEVEPAESIIVKPNERNDCAKCNKTFSSIDQLNIHVSLIHDIEQNDYQQVVTVATDEFKYPCDKCERKFRNPSSVLYHKDAEHNSGRRFVCSKCNKVFKLKQLLQRHQLVHTEDRPYPCDVCSASFKTKPNLMNHLAKHSGIKKHECRVCNQAFAHKTSLKLHYRWHTGSKPFECKECGKMFTQNGNLQEHMRVHTGERPYECNHCDKKFKTSSQCRIHTKRHINYKPFECNICSKSFLHFDIYRTHLRRHNNEKPFACALCPKMFSEQWALRKHTRIHTGEKPYHCNFCNKAFNDCSNLTKHKKTHEKTDATTSVAELVSADAERIEIGELTDAEAMQASATGTVPVSSTLPDGTVWKLLQNTDIDGNSGDPNQIIYVTYQDPNDPGNNKTMQVLSNLTGTDFSNIAGINATGDERLQQTLMEQSLAETEPIEILSGDDITYGDEINDFIQQHKDPSDMVVVRGVGNNGSSCEAYGNGLVNNDDDDIGEEVSDVHYHKDDMQLATSPLQFSVVDELPIQLTDDKVMLRLDGAQNGLFDENGQSIEFVTSDGRKLQLLTHYTEPLNLSAEFK